jgi:adenylate cyclase
MLRAWPLLATLACLSSPLAAQCSDGTPLPCKSARPTGLPLVAVLQFENVTRDTTEAYLAPGLAEEIIRALSQTPGLRVASRFQTRRFGTGANKDPAAIARELDATFILSGSLQRIGDSIRVGVELTRAPTFAIVWDEKFDRSAGNLGGIIDELSLIVAREALGRVPRRTASVDGTVPSEVMQRFLRGNFLVESRGAAIVRGIAEYTRATALAPNFGRAWARHAFAHALLIDNGVTYDGLSSDSIVGRGWRSLEKAKRLSPNESDTWMAEGYLRKHRYPRTYLGVTESFQRALALDPLNAEAHHQYGVVLLNIERDSAGIAEFHRALELDPDRSVSAWDLARAYHMTRQFREALEWYDRVAARGDGMNAPLRQQYIVRAYLSLGDTVGARTNYEKYRALRTSRGLVANDPLDVLYAVAIGDTAAARVQLQSLRGAGPMMVAALLAVGQTGPALDMLEQMRPDLAELRFLRFPEFDAIRDDPRFRHRATQSRSDP